MSGPLEPAEGAAGLMVLRLWTEPGGRLRVRITASPGLDAAGTVTTYAASPAEILAQVEDWLDHAVTPR